MFDFIRH